MTISEVRKMRLDAKLLRSLLYERDIKQIDLADRSEVARITVNKLSLIHI